MENTEKKENSNRPKGIKTFKKRDNAPDFVLGDLILTPKEFFKWCAEKKEHLTEYTDKDNVTHKQLKFQIKNGDYGIYFELNTWKSDQNQNKTGSFSTPVDNEEDDLPF